MFVAPPASVLACVDVLTALSGTILLTTETGRMVTEPSHFSLLRAPAGLPGPMVCGSL
jgi:hypothetical protein